MKKFADFVQYMGMVAAIVVLTKPRKRPPLYIDPDGTFHWTIHISYLPPPGAEMIRKAGAGYSDLIRELLDD